MKGKIVLAGGLLVAFVGSSHAAARPEVKYPPVDDVAYRLAKLELRVDLQAQEIASIRAQNQQLRLALSNVLAINDHVALVDVHGRPTVRFSAVNLQVVNGEGTTNTSNGTGNLIVGYDRLRGLYSGYEEVCSLGTVDYDVRVRDQAQCEAAGGKWLLDHKSGSHYLVVGDWHNYSQWGGIVTGIGNTVNAPWASVSGGSSNIASGFSASVSGGHFGTAVGPVASVSGGYLNEAIGSSSSVGGGWLGVASGSGSSVTGGHGNTASGIVSSVSGGGGNAATADSASVSGGAVNTASGYWSSVSGGVDRTAAGTHDWAGGSY